MSHDRWEDFLDELCESPEEVAGLKETATLFNQLPETHYSSSFQEDLRQKLLFQAAEQGKGRKRQQKVISFLKGVQWRRSRSLGLVAAAVLFVFFVGSVINNPSFVGSVINNPSTGPGKPEASGQELGEIPLISDAGVSLPENSDISPADTNVDERPDTITGKPTQGGEQGGEVEGVGGQVPITPAEEGRTSPDSSAQQQSEPTRPADAQQNGESDGVAPLPDEPDFEVYKNYRTFTVAGAIVLNYGSAADEYYSVENVRYNWEPNKIVLAAENGYSFGTTEWARQLLTDEGFRVGTGDTLKVKTHETKKGLYAEIFHQVSPALVLHVHQERGILAYYYEEKSAVAPQGFYSLLAPAKALEQQLQLKSSIEGQQLNFSFREVRFTYHDFLVEKNGTQEKIRFPAYRFTGGETYQGNDAVSFYVPAVK